MFKKPMAGRVNPTTLSATPASLPAPVGGLNFRDPLTSMRPGDALILDNLLCRPEQVEGRKGQENFVTGFNAKVWALMPYRAAPVDKLFAATDNGIYDATVAGEVGAPVHPCTNGKWESINGANAGIRYLLACNGVDPVALYNGTVWANAEITGADSSKFTNISHFKFRVFFTYKDSLSFYYLGVNAVQGPASEFPLAPLFVKGGSLLASGNWTIDGGDGSDDYAVFITTEGEVAVYKGTDPSNAANWALHGVYSIARPIGKKCLFKYGGDLIILTESGLVKMSSVLQGNAIERQTTISDKIVGGLSSDARAYKANFGWGLTLYSGEDIVLLNVPTVEGAQAVQYAMNTLTRAWSKFKNINALCIAEMGSRLYAGMDGKVALILAGKSDFGANIVLTMKTAYTTFGMPTSRKHVKLLRMNYLTSKALKVNMALTIDYSSATYISSTSATSNNEALFDASTWDQAFWTGDEFISSNWRTVAHKPGHALSLLVQISDKDYSFSWTNTDYLLSNGFSF